MIAARGAFMLTPAGQAALAADYRGRFADLRGNAAFVAAYGRFEALNSELKQLILYTILADVFLAPWGLASTRHLNAVILAVVALLAKACAVGCVVAVIDNSFAKLRLFKITEFVAGAFLLAVLGVFTLYLGGG